MRSYNGLYKVLNVLPEADPVVIDAAYRALIKKHHPDKQGEERRATELNHAYAVLRDPERRAAYDEEEVARRERNRVELARLNQAPPAQQAEDGRRASPPKGFRPPMRAERRLAAWAGVIGVLVLTAALFLFARGSTELQATARPPSVGAPAETPQPPARGDMLEQDELAFSDLPVNRRTVSDAVSEFRQVSERGGLQAAADFSERCFEGQRRTRGIGDFDYCVAFDHAATRIDLVPAKDGQEQVAQFQPKTLLARHVGAADRLSSDETLIEARLFEIRRLADAALVDFGYPGQAEANKPKSAAVTISSPALQRSARPRPQAQNRVPPRRPVRPRPQQRPADFLEREGGIY